MEQIDAAADRYRIDTDLLERAGRSFDMMVEQRLCATARRHLGELREDRLAGGDPEHRRVAFGARHPASTPLDLIREYCLDDLGYLHSDLPILEACFRLFLLNGNQSLTLAELRQELDHWPGFSERLRPIADEQVIEMLTHDGYYGLRQVAD
ncbi:MAG: hypothetical protein U0556_12375 [Dehalococcoidia bacterium]